MAQTWSYADVRDVENWDDGLAEFRRQVKSTWQERATEAGYKLKKGSELTERIVPLWRNSAGDYTELSQGGEPVARKLVVTGLVTRKKKAK